MCTWSKARDGLVRRFICKPMNCYLNAKTGLQYLDYSQPCHPAIHSHKVVILDLPLARRDEERVHGPAEMRRGFCHFVVASTCAAMLQLSHCGAQKDRQTRPLAAISSASTLAKLLHNADNRDDTALLS